VLLNLFPGGALQFMDVLKNGYWHARSPAFLDTKTTTLIEWLRLPADAIFIVFGVAPILIAATLTYLRMRRSRQIAS